MPESEEEKRQMESRGRKRETVRDLAPSQICSIIAREKRHNVDEMALNVVRQGIYVRAVELGDKHLFDIINIGEYFLNGKNTHAGEVTFINC